MAGSSAFSRKLDTRAREPPQHLLKRLLIVVVDVVIVVGIGVVVDVVVGVVVVVGVGVLSEEPRV